MQIHSADMQVCVEFEVSDINISGDFDIKMAKIEDIAAK